MKDRRDHRLGRRQFIAGAGATMLGGCVCCRDQLAEPWQSAHHAISDVHAHFFNLSDLPTKNFVTHVLVPNRMPERQDTWAAISDLADWWKDWAPTIAEERRILALPFSDASDLEVGERDFSNRLADRINRYAGFVPGEAGFAPAEAEPALAASYRALAAALAGDAGTAPSAPRPLDPARIEAELSGRRAAPARFAEESEVDPCSVERKACIAGDSCDEPRPTEGMQLDEYWNLIRWVFEMLQGRCNHLLAYLRRMRSHEAGPVWRPRLVVHHLVDYDRWLDEEPASGSGHEAQIEFWSDFGGRAADEIELFTFAGYDPLRHAEERILTGGAASFRRLQAHFDATRIKGFKLYPPMGFKPSGNVSADYQLPAGASGHAARRARGIVGRRWRTNPLLAGEDLGGRLNEALAEFFDFCVDRDAPILSHAIRGNQADCCFGQRAHPRHWLDLFAREPRYRRLRICLGHFVSDAACFVKAMEANERDRHAVPPDIVWALHGTHRLLEMSAAGEANVYVDISYLDEILKKSDSAARAFSVRFFQALRTYCSLYDPRCERLLFGTDWIVLGWEREPERYVDLVRHGMAGADWPEEWQRNLLHDNMRRFLARAR